MGGLNNLWMITVATAFWGPVLALSAYPHVFAYRVLFIIHFMALALTLLTHKNTATILQQIKVRDQLCFYAIWFIWAIITVLWADSKIASARHLWSLFTGISLIGFTVLYINSTEKLIRYAGLCTVTLLVFMAIGLWENITGLHIKFVSSIDPVIYGSEFKIPTVVFSNRNDYATYLALFLPFLYGWTRHTRWWTKLLAWLFILLGIYLITVTSSRANLLALLLMVGAGAMLYLLDAKLKGLKNLLVCTVLLAGLWWGTAALGINTIEIKNLVYQVTSLHSETQVRGGSIQVRMGLMKAGLEMLKNHYFMGVGAGNVEYHMQNYWLWTKGLQNLHNWWLEVLVNYGLIIWGLYLYFYGKLMWSLFTVLRKSQEVWLKRLAEAILISMVGFLIGCTSSSTLYSASFIWILYGMGLAVYNRYLNTDRPVC